MLNINAKSSLNPMEIFAVIPQSKLMADNMQLNHAFYVICWAYMGHQKRERMGTIFLFGPEAEIWEE